MIKRSIFYFKRVLFLGLTMLFMSAVSTPDRTGKKIFKLIIKEKIQKIETYYLDKEEFIEFVNTMDPKPSSEQLNAILENYDATKKDHLKTFEELDLDKIGNLKIDRIEYDYQIAKKGKDDKVIWPDAKNYKPINTPTEQIKANLKFYLKADNKEYIMNMELMNYKGKWKLLHLLRPCSIYEDI